MNRLSNIATRQRKSFVRDLVFTACVALAAAVSITSVSTACQAATTSSAQVAHR
jgi:hypothetical protein